MRKIWIGVIGLLFGCALVWGAVNFHVFHTPSGIVIAVKRSPTLADVYVDVRDWGLVQWSEFPDLAWSLTRSGHAELVQTRPNYDSARRIEVDIHR
jgi:hypothetical protein